ncbi:class I SAM-dependent methyltransferase [Acuticoccus sp. MNP-M23]|uniref:class I SAM-dependent DNA methyltransferase n=1 Tax=Acuticoccus sp. MNP-M23 TaxID=3072793 RepID=UPI0028153A03|nr:class I SAM-dependent methyltransferase [Acuticoccus sp. MNP-M23]WMS44852.1 class I SAM-dependent methyltransferase [Acuticoccus sp. MNP-M23]
MADRGDLGRAWAATSPEETRQHYDVWAKTYDAENYGKGLRLPFIAAAFLARHLPPGAGPVLDAACGTGLGGESLAALGYGPITGCDISAEMRAVARMHGVYAALEHADLTALPFADDAFAGFLCAGAFGPGHAPPSALEELARVTRPGGIGVFTLRDDTHAEQGFQPVMARLAAEGRWREREHTGPIRTFLLAEPDIFARVVTVEILG